MPFGKTLTFYFHNVSEVNFNYNDSGKIRWEFCIWEATAKFLKITC